MTRTPSHSRCQLLRHPPFGGGSLSPTTPAASSFDPGFQSKLAFHPNLERFSRNIIHVHLQTPPRINERRPRAFQRFIDCSRMPLPEGNEKDIRELFKPVFFGFPHNVCPNAFQAVRPERDTKRCITILSPSSILFTFTIESKESAAGYYYPRDGKLMEEQCRPSLLSKDFIICGNTTRRQISGTSKNVSLLRCDPLNSQF